MWSLPAAYANILSHLFALASRCLLILERRPKPRSITNSPLPIKSDSQLVKEIVRSFISRLSYTPPEPCPSNFQALQESLKDYVKTWELEGRLTADHLDKTCAHAAAMAELSYHDHDFDTKLQIARFTWFMLYLDDLAPKMPSALERFQSCMLRKQPIEDKVLQHFATHLGDMYRFWDALPANSIACAALEFVNGCALENHRDVQSVAPAYSFMIFTKKMHPKLSHFIQTIADINVFIDLTNDILSFYKESLDGEKGNYITNRSLALGKPPIRVLSEVVEEAFAAYSRVSVTLETRGTPEAYAAWITFVHGYLAFHITQDRYRLQELNF